MKIPKDAARAARQLIRATVRSGTIDTAFVKAVATKLSTEKPRNYLAILTSYQRLLRLEFNQRHAVIESAAPLSTAESASALADLKAKYGSEITSEYKVSPELIGGIKVKLGSHVWDGSIKARLEALKDQLGA